MTPSRLLFICELAVFVCLLLISAPLARGQELVYDRYLLPVFGGGQRTPGANGSLWEADALISNVDVAPAYVRNLSWPCFLLCTEVAIPPGVTIPVTFRTNQGLPGRGRFLHIEHGRSVAVQLRVRDVSRSAINWGAEVPVVSEKEAQPVVHITGVPLTDGYRQLLRVYDFSLTETLVRVKVFNVIPTFRPDFVYATGDTLLGSIDLPLVFGSGDEPNYAQFDALSVLASGNTHGVVRISIESVRPGAKLWAMVTVTNNSTQQITNVTPNGSSAALP